VVRGSAIAPREADHEEGSGGGAVVRSDAGSFRSLGKPPLVADVVRVGGSVDAVLLRPRRFLSPQDYLATT